MEIGSLYIPTITEWRAFARGVRDRNQPAERCGNDDLQLAYDCGQQFGRMVAGWFGRN